MTELDKEFIEKIGEMASDDKERGRQIALAKLEEHGGVEKTVIYEGMLVFILNDGHKQTYAPRGYKFRGPIVPQGIDTKQFEVR